jgi:3-methylcrotonyl-CoA carboxylase alpha subunit
MPGVRVDAGVVEGDEVSVHYDPMLAKVIASGESRGQAIARLEAALRRFPVLGIRTNIPFLLRIVGDPLFRDGHVHTGFLDGDGAALAQTIDSPPPAFVIAAIEAAAASDAGKGVADRSRSENWDPWVRLNGWRP